MNILLIKMSSMGDLIHTLPALTDAMNAIPNLEIDWVVEPAFADIPSWHPAVKNIIPIALRQWRKNIFHAIVSGDIKKFYNTLREKKYDAIIDPQGLLKSAIVAKLARGKIHGYDKNSAREFISSYFYDKKYAITKNLHAVTRTRQLFSQAFQYDLPDTRPNFQIDTTQLPVLDFETPEKYFVFLHSTSWETKLYPEKYWEILLKKTQEKNITIFLPWGNKDEKNRAERLALHSLYAKILPKISISQIATFLKNATAVVAMDTGLGHLAAALRTPTIGLYGPTDSELVGVRGDRQVHLQAQFPCSPCKNKTCLYAKKHKTEIVPACYATIDPDKVWEQLSVSVSDQCE